ncbi:MAG: SPFH domain-containing protein, partial [Gemmatimonas sp.]
METSIDSTLEGLRSSMRNSLTGGSGRAGGSGGGGIRRLLLVGGVLLIGLFVIKPMVAYIEPGHVGIVIHRGGGGVDPQPLGPGFHFRNPAMTAIQEYPTFMQTLVLTRDATEGSPNN